MSEKYTIFKSKLDITKCSVLLLFFLKIKGRKLNYARDSTFM